MAISPIFLTFAANSGSVGVFAFHWYGRGCLCSYTKSGNNRDKMNIKLRIISYAFLLSLLSVGCTQQSVQQTREPGDDFIRTPGDSTVYALVAAGTNDSILVFLELPYMGADPDTVSILDAKVNRQMFGRPEVGDNVAIVRNDSDATVAECVIVTEKLVGQWCYEVLPRLRRKIGDGPLPARIQQMLDEPREYSLVMKQGGEAITIGSRARQSDEQLPVVYPLAKNYGRWEIFNGHLVLAEVRLDTLGTVATISTDTASFVRLRRDTLTLRFADGERSFYRKNLSN